MQKGLPRSKGGLTNQPCEVGHCQVTSPLSQPHSSGNEVGTSPTDQQGGLTLSFQEFGDPGVIPHFVLLITSLSLQIFVSLSLLLLHSSLQSIFHCSIQSCSYLLKIWGWGALPFCSVAWSQASISHAAVPPCLYIATNTGLTASNHLLISSQKLPQFVFFAPVLYSDPYSFCIYMHFHVFPSRKMLNERHLRNQGPFRLLTACQTSKPANHTWIRVVTTVLYANADFFRPSANV